MAGLVFAPRLLVAILATTNYWLTNTVLCVLTWFWALSGESIEKTIVVYKGPRYRRHRRY